MDNVQVRTEIYKHQRTRQPLLGVRKATELLTMLKDCKNRNCGLELPSI